MAKRGKKADEKKPDKSIGQQVGQRKLRELMASARSAHQDTREIAGTLGAEIKDAVENHHLHKKAFSVIRTADRMEPEKLVEFLDCLDLYLDLSGLRERAAKAPRLGLDDDQTNVKPFPAPSSVAAE